MLLKNLTLGTGKNLTLGAGKDLGLKRGVSITASSSMSAMSASGQVSRTVTVSASLTMSAMQASGAMAGASSCAGSVAMSALTMAASVARTVTCSGAAEMSAMTASGSFHMTVTCYGVATMSAMTLAAQIAAEETPEPAASHITSLLPLSGSGAEFLNALLADVESVAGSDDGGLAFVRRSGETAAIFDYRPPHTFTRAVLVAQHSSGERIMTGMDRPGPVALGGLYPGRWVIWAAAIATGIPYVFVTKPLVYHHHQVLPEDAFTIEFRTDYDDQWRGGEYPTNATRERLVPNATAHHLEWRARGTAQNKRITIQSVMLEVRAQGMAYSAEQTG